MEYDKKYSEHTYFVRECVHNSLIDKAGHIVLRTLPLTAYSSTIVVNLPLLITSLASMHV